MLSWEGHGRSGQWLQPQGSGWLNIFTGWIENHQQLQCNSREDIALRDTLMCNVSLFLSTKCKELNEMERFCGQNSGRRWKSRVKLGSAALSRLATWSHLKTLTLGFPGSILCISLLSVLEAKGQCDLPPWSSLQGMVDPGALHHSQVKDCIMVLCRDQHLGCCSLWLSLDHCQLCHFLRGAPALSPKNFLPCWVPQNDQGACHQWNTWQKPSPDAVQDSQLSHSGLWLYRHCWCSSSLHSLPKGHSGLPAPCFPIILILEVHFIRSRMPSSWTHLKHRKGMYNSCFSSFSLYRQRGPCEYQDGPFSIYKNHEASECGLKTVTPVTLCIQGRNISREHSVHWRYKLHSGGSCYSS